MGVALLWLGVGVVCGLLGWAAADGRLVRSAWTRRRPPEPTPDPRWTAAQEAGGPILLGAGALVGTMGFLLLVFRPGGDVTALVSLFLGVGLVGAVIGAGVVGTRAAASLRGA